MCRNMPGEDLGASSVLSSMHLQRRPGKDMGHSSHVYHGCKPERTMSITNAQSIARDAPLVLVLVLVR